MKQELIGEPVKSMYIIQDNNGTSLATSEGLYKYALRMYPNYVDEIDDKNNPIDCIDYIDRQSEGKVNVEYWFYEVMPIKEIEGAR